MQKRDKDGRVRCLRCGNKWYPRKAGDPRQCSKCHSVLWNVRKARAMLGVDNETG